MLRTQSCDSALLQRRAPSESALGVAVIAVVAALTAFNVAQVVTLNWPNARTGRRVPRRPKRGPTRLREPRAKRRRETLDPRRCRAVQASAREANLLIERRAFSWTDLFNRFEETLPADVRVAAVQPQVDDEGRMLIVVTVYFAPRRRSRTLHRAAREDGRRSAGCCRGRTSREEDGTLAVGDPGLLHTADRAAEASPAASESQKPPPAIGARAHPAPHGEGRR